MTCSSDYAPQLRSLGFRVTAQRMAVLHVLRRSAGHLSPTEVHDRTRREVPGITATTVYRTLEFLSRNGLVWRTSRARGHLSYELAEHHHHHLACRYCGADVALSGSVVEDAFRKLEAASGYSIDHDHVSLAGICPRCRKVLRKG